MQRHRQGESVNNRDNAKLYGEPHDYDKWVRFIDKYIFDENDRTILKRHLLDNRTFEQVADETKLSVQTVKKRYYKASEKLFARLKRENKITSW